MPEQFIVPSNNHRGASERITFRCLPELKREIEELFYSKRWPYMTISDLMRHSLYRHAEWLASQSPAESNIAYLEALIQDLNREHELVLFQRVVEHLAEIVTEHLNAGDKDDAQRAVGKVLRAVDAMPKGNMRNRYEKQVLGQYGSLIGIVDGKKNLKEIVSLLPEDIVQDAD